MKSNANSAHGAAENCHTPLSGQGLAQRCGEISPIDRIGLISVGPAPRASVTALLAGHTLTPEIQEQAERVCLDLDALSRGAGTSRAFRKAATEDFDKLAAMLRSDQ